MDAKVKHLEFIQATINRMAGNSFLLKGWTVTLAGGLLALTFKEANRHYLYISYAILGVFWLLDSYYLSRERRFIALYNSVRKKRDHEIDFSMDTSAEKQCKLLVCAFSKTVLLFYGGLFAVHVLFNLFS